MKKNLFLNLLSLGLSLFVFTNMTAQKCDAALRSAELLPYGTKSCNGKTGNYLQLILFLSLKEGKQLDSL